MKIFIVTSYASSAVNFRGPLIQCMTANNCHVTILAPDHSPKTNSALKALGASTASFPMERVGTSVFADIYSLIYLHFLMSQSRPDVVLTYFTKPNVWAGLAAATSRVAWRVSIVEGLGYAFVRYSSGRDSIRRLIVSWLIKRLYQLSFHFADRVVFLNRDDMQELSKCCRIPSAKSFLLGGIGVDLTEWQFSPPFVEPITFTMASRLLKEKGVYEFLNAAKIVKSRYTAVKFFLLGGLDDNPGSIKPVDLNPWIDMDIVEWMGHVDVVQWLNKTSVFVLPSYYREGVPRSIQEAMAMGRPVITTDVPGCRDTVNNGVNGYLVQPLDPTALANAMFSFIENPSLIESMGIASRRMAEELFDVQRANEKLMSVMNL